jgi:hypothetical protein
LQASRFWAVIICTVCHARTTLGAKRYTVCTREFTEADELIDILGLGDATFEAPFDLRHVGVFNERDHRKIIVVDGRTAFIGGHCIVDTWLGDAKDEKHFADVSVRLRGPIVHSVQKLGRVDR